MLCKYTIKTDTFLKAMYVFIGTHLHSGKLYKVYEHRSACYVDMFCYIESIQSFHVSQEFGPTLTWHVFGTALARKRAA